MFEILEHRTNFSTVRFFKVNTSKGMMFVNDLENYGFILKCLREHSGLSVRGMAKKIGRSVGWLSEIENGKGLARLPAREFERIVDQADGAKHRGMFRTWVANHKNAQRVDRTFDGAVLKYIRKKKGLKLSGAARSSGLSAAHLSKLERGLRPLTAELRKRLMLAYGYSPSSFKNLATDPIRSNSVPLSYKLEILLGLMTQDQIGNVFKYAREMAKL